MVARARKARVRKSSEASESRGEAGEKGGKEDRLSPVSLSANSLSPVLPSLDLTEEGLLAVYSNVPTTGRKDPLFRQPMRLCLAY